MSLNGPPGSPELCFVIRQISTALLLPLRCEADVGSCFGPGVPGHGAISGTKDSFCLMRAGSRGLMESMHHAVGPIVTFDQGEAAQLGKRTVIGRHNLADDSLFCDESIATVLDGYPAERLFALTMGTDPLRSADNERLDHRGVSGADLLEAVRNGRIWLNITGIDGVDPRFRELTDRLYRAIDDSAPRSFSETHATLLVSSPGAMVYYHVDGPPSYLWHIRGEKRLWVYPALNESILSLELLEDVFAGARQEYVPYRNEFDELAEVFDLKPGQVAAWPQNAPHRVINGDSLNVSLVTDHFTPDARRRARVYSANQFLRTRAHVPRRLLSTKEEGGAATAKVVVHKLATRAGLGNPVNKAHEPSVRRVDPSSPTGMSGIEAFRG